MDPLDPTSRAGLPPTPPRTGRVGPSGRLPMSAVEDFPYKWRGSDLCRRPSKALGPLAELLRRPVEGRVGMREILQAIERVSQRTGRMLQLLHEAQQQLPKRSKEAEIFSFLATSISTAGFERVLVYRAYADGRLHCVSGASIDPRTSAFSSDRPARVPPARSLWGIAVKEAQSADPVLLQKIDDPLIDPRCPLSRLQGADSRYTDPHIAVPLIDATGRVWGFIAVWVEQGETEKFDPGTCTSFILLAKMAADRLAALA